MAAKKVGTLIKEARTNAGLTQEQLAETLGVSSESLTYEVVEQEKKGFLGIGSSQAKIKVEQNVSGDVIAKDFVDKTGVDALAIAVGNAHGAYKLPPKLDFERLADIRNSIDTPLVLHGGSGLPDESVKKAISLGIAKVNFATELRNAATIAVREILKDENVIDPKKYMGPARENVYKLCIEKIKLCGSQNKA